MGKAWVIKDTDRYFYRLGVRRATKGMPFADEKNPARAYTFSLFFWGAGQSYSGQRMKSVLFQIFMLFFLMTLGLSLLFTKDLLAALQTEGIFRAEAFLAAELLLFVVLNFWAYNAADAYYAAAKARRVPFRGVQSRALPPLCSFLIPGWGQFLNGQPKKGLVLASLSVLGIFSLVTIPAVLLCWPSLEPSRARSIIEAVFAVTVLYAPGIPVISLSSSYDALRVSLDDVKKESMLDRLVSAINRVQSEGLASGLFPLIKTCVVLALLIGSIAIVKNRYHLPGDYINTRLTNAQTWLHKQGMTVVPDLISRFLAGTVMAGK